MTVRVKSDRRAEILAAARAVFAEKGLEDSKISDIVARAGVAQGTFYLYFPSKTSLLSALGDDLDDALLGSIQEATAAQTSFAGKIEAGIRAAFRTFEECRDVIMTLRSALGTSQRHGEGLEAEKANRPFYTFIEALIHQGQELGEVEPSINPSLSARLVLGVVDRAAEEFYLYPPEWDSETYIREVVAFVQRALIKH
ncbi:MAG: TetR/AcrR family transcriptional regulator [Thermaceae bacterium]|nr:TetR/AcrR family transcriptional regulator [Thermaceae bacterium]